MAVLNPPAAPARQVCLSESVVVVDCTGSMVIQFISAIDQAEADESWAFSNVQVLPGRCSACRAWSLPCHDDRSDHGAGYRLERRGGHSG